MFGFRKKSKPEEPEEKQSGPTGLGAAIVFFRNPSYHLKKHNKGALLLLTVFAAGGFFLFFEHILPTNIFTVLGKLAYFAAGTYGLIRYIDKHTAKKAPGAKMMERGTRKHYSDGETK